MNDCWRSRGRQRMELGGVALALLALAFVTSRPAAGASAPRISKETQLCLDCHSEFNPGLVQDWMHSLHSQVTPEEALKKKPLERRVSSENIPDSLKGVVVGCYECHSLHATNHTDNFAHFDFHINVVVSPPDCQVCHTVEAEQYSGSKKAHAAGNLQKNPLFHTMVDGITSVAELKDGKLVPAGSSDQTKNETCYGCHGSRVEVLGTRKLNTEVGDTDLPILSNWPNQGVGRINPDGSRGACTACHPRHEFSIEVARKPYTCSQCHTGPDVPAFEVYEESKHGNIFHSKGQEWNWTHVPWRIGEDFRAPTCAACHSSLLVAGDVVAPRTHDFGARLWVRLFGLPYTHPQPKSGDTTLIRNKDGLPLPTTFSREQRNPRSLNGVRKMAMPEQFIEWRCKIGTTKAASVSGVFILEALKSITIFGCIAAQAAGRRCNGLLWRPLPKAPPFGRGFLLVPPIGTFERLSKSLLPHPSGQTFGATSKTSWMALARCPSCRGPAPRRPAMGYQNVASVSMKSTKHAAGHKK